MYDMLLVVCSDHIVNPEMKVKHGYCRLLIGVRVNECVGFNVPLDK